MILDNEINPYSFLIKNQLLMLLGFSKKDYILYNVNIVSDTFFVLNFSHSSYKIEMFFGNHNFTAVFIANKTGKEDNLLASRQSLKQSSDMFLSHLSSFESVDETTTFTLTDSEFLYSDDFSMHYKDERVYSKKLKEGTNEYFDSNYLLTLACISLHSGISLDVDDYLFLKDVCGVHISAEEWIKREDRHRLLDLLFFDENNKLSKNSRELIELNYGC